VNPAPQPVLHLLLELADRDGSGWIRHFFEVLTVEMTGSGVRVTSLFLCPQIASAGVESKSSADAGVKGMKSLLVSRDAQRSAPLSRRG
jgi:hypothetical protein